MSNVQQGMSNFQVSVTSILDVPCWIFRLHLQYCRMLRANLSVEC